MTNEQLAAIFEDIAKRLEIKGDENPFAIRAYKAVSETLSGYEQPIRQVWQNGGIDELVKIKGIGKEIAKKIDSFLSTGSLAFYDTLRAAVPDGVVDMLRVPGFGPKRVKQVWDEKGVDSIAKLDAAAKAGQLRDLPKFGAKLEAKIIEGIAALGRMSTGRMSVGSVWPVAQSIIAALRKLPQVQHIEPAGSLRRGRPTIGDLDLIVATLDAQPIMDAFVALQDVREVLGHGPTKSSIRLESGLQVDLRAVEPAVMGTALQYFTGSQQHNIRLRELAQRAGWSLNEYSLKDTGDIKREKDAPTELKFATEAGLYAFLGLPLVPPTMREDRGEFELAPAALAAQIADLVTLRDMRGDLQMHSTYSDGETTMLDMARNCIALGYAYMLTTDHTQSLGVANGLTPDRVLAQGIEIKQLNLRFKDDGVAFTILHGVEVEVKSDGSLDLPDDILAGCDLVQASVHTSLGQPRAQITERAIRAMSSPHIDILGHPAGSIVNEREGADYDWDGLFAAAAKLGVALEINAAPKRLDLNEQHARRAIALGCKLTISTDAHNVNMLRNMHHGIAIAQRAWVRKADVVNTWALADVLAWAARIR